MREILDALAKAIDPAKLEAALPRSGHGEGQGHGHGHGDGKVEDELLGRLVLADILDDEILGARPGDKGFFLRTFLSRMGDALRTDSGFTLSAALNFYFRAAMDEETKMRLGVEASRAFYRFTEETGMARAEVAQVAPLVAALMTSELSRLKLESVDHAAVFDSQVHDREPGSDAASARITAPKTFLCRVSVNNMVRVKAMVRT